VPDNKPQEMINKMIASEQTRENRRDELRSKRWHSELTREEERELRQLFQPMSWETYKTAERLQKPVTDPAGHPVSHREPIGPSGTPLSGFNEETRDKYYLALANEMLKAGEESLPEFMERYGLRQGHGTEEEREVGTRDLELGRLMKRHKTETNPLIKLRISQEVARALKGEDISSEQIGQSEESAPRSTRQEFTGSYGEASPKPGTAPRGTVMHDPRKK